MCVAWTFGCTMAAISAAMRTSPARTQFKVNNIPFRKLNNVLEKNVRMQLYAEYVSLKNKLSEFSRFVRNQLAYSINETPSHSTDFSSKRKSESANQNNHFDICQRSRDANDSDLKNRNK